MPPVGVGGCWQLCPHARHGVPSPTARSQYAVESPPQVTLFRRCWTLLGTARGLRPGGCAGSAPDARASDSRACVQETQLQSISLPGPEGGPSHGSQSTPAPSPLCPQPGHSPRVGQQAQTPDPRPTQLLCPSHLSLRRHNREAMWRVLNDLCFMMLKGPFSSFWKNLSPAARRHKPGQPEDCQRVENGCARFLDIRLGPCPPAYHPVFFFDGFPQVGAGRPPVAQPTAAQHRCRCSSEPHWPLPEGRQRTQRQPGQDDGRRAGPSRRQQVGGTEPTHGLWGLVWPPHQLGCTWGLPEAHIHRRGTARLTPASVSSGCTYRGHIKAASVENRPGGAPKGQGLVHTSQPLPCPHGRQHTAGRAERAASCRGRLAGRPPA